MHVVKNVINSEKRCASNFQVNDNQTSLHLRVSLHSSTKNSDNTKAVSRKIVDHSSKLVRSFISSQNKRICHSQVNSYQKFLHLWMAIFQKDHFTIDELILSFFSMPSLCSTCNPLIWDKPYFLHMKCSLYFGDNSLLFYMFY